jgi:hypothetical protein
MLLLAHHWARGMPTFLTQEQRLAFATAMLFSFYSGSRPAALFDTAKRRHAQHSRLGTDGADGADDGADNPDNPDVVLHLDRP